MLAHLQWGWLQNLRPTSARDTGTGALARAFALLGDPPDSAVTLVLVLSCPSWLEQSFLDSGAWTAALQYLPSELRTSLISIFFAEAVTVTPSTCMQRNSG